MLRSQAADLQRSLGSADLVASVCAYLGAVACLNSGHTHAPSGFEPWLLGLGLGVSLASPRLTREAGLWASQKRRGLFAILSRAVVVSCLLGFVVFVGAYWVSTPAQATTLAFAFGGLYFGLISLSRAAFYCVLRLLRRGGRNYRNLVVVGTGPRAGRLIELLDDHPEWGLRVSALADETDETNDPKLSNYRIEKLSELPSVLRDEVVDEVIVACPRSMFSSTEAVVRCCAEIGIPVTLLSDIFGDFLPPPRVVQMDRVLGLSFAPVHHSFFSLLIKRAVDFVGASVLLVLSAPILALAALLIRMTSPGPVLFRQERCGLNRRRFDMVKLRTMSVDAEILERELLHLNERKGPVFKIRNDPRVTPVGRFLRRWSIDELPQLWNVLKGDMSLVGPRPPLPREVREYRFVDQRRLSMRPGLTCWWQVSGRNETDFDEQVRLDIAYIDSWSLLNDVRILFRTIPAVLSGRGAS